MICDRCFHSVVCKYADQDYDLEECGEFISKDVVEVKHGEWLEDSGNIACSKCHTIWLYRRTDFCPNCGADMRERKETDEMD